MASLSSSISSLFSGLSYLISAFFESIFAILRHILNLFENILSTLVGAIRESVHAAADVLGHVVKFLAENFLFLGILAAGIFIALAWSQNQNRGGNATKKRAC